MSVLGSGSWALLVQQDPLPVIVAHSACTNAFLQLLLLIDILRNKNCMSSAQGPGIDGSAWADEDRL
jgi:hypothetical protein